MTTDLPVSRTGATDREVEAVARAIAQSDGVDYDAYLTGALLLDADYRGNAEAAIAAVDAARAAAAPETDQVRVIEAVTFIGRWVDASLTGRVQEVRDRVRITKVCEESGEVWSALDRVYGANPRKVGSWDEVDKELLDTAGAALGAIEYRRGYDGQSLRLLADHMVGVAARAAALLAEQPGGGR